MPYTLRDYQRNVALVTQTTDRLAYLWSPRLGKSLMALDFLLRRGVKRAVISAPLVVCPQWVELCEAEGLEVIKGYKGLCSDLGRRLDHDLVVVVNDDRLKALQPAIARFKPDLFVGDESHRFRGVSTGRGKAMRAITKKIPLIRLLTGTPTPNHVGNIWGQMVAIDPDLWGRSYEKFAEKFLIRDSMFKSKVLGVVREEELRSMILAGSSILRREEVFGPDEWQEVVRDVTLPPMAARMYSQLVKEWITEVNPDLVVDAFHLLKRMTRLQELTSGYLPDADGQAHEIHSAKLDLVVNDVEDILNAGESVVIFHRFTWEGETYARELAHRLRHPVVSINGGTSSRDRELSIRTINDTRSPSVGVIQTQSGGIGISLKGATHALFVSQSFNFDDEQQARDRIFEPGKSKCVTYYRVKNSIDSYIARVLESKQNIHEAVRHADIRSIAYDTQEVRRGNTV